MARLDSSALEDFAVLPWWLCVLLAAIAFFALRYFVPSFAAHPADALCAQETFRGSTNMSFAKVTPMFAPFVAGFFLLTGALSALNRWRKGHAAVHLISIEDLQTISWRDFEGLVGEAYRRKGYEVAEHGEGRPGAGADLVLSKDGEKILVQCKCWKTKMVGVRAVRELFGSAAAENACGGIAVSCGTFSDKAKEFAAGKPLELIDGDELRRITAGIKKDASIFPGKTHSACRVGTNGDLSPSMSSTTVLCPVCGSEMVLRTITKGSRSGEQFLGCSAYPKCRGTRPYKK